MAFNSRDANAAKAEQVVVDQCVGNGLLQMKSTNGLRRMESVEPSAVFEVV